MTERPPEPATRWAALRQSLREQWWAHPLIAGTLVVLFDDVGDPWPELLETFGIYLLISLCIGSATTAVSVLAWHVLVASGGPMRRALGHGLSIVIGVLVGTEVAVQVLRLIASSSFDVSAARQGVWRVGLVVTAVVMMGSLTYDRLRERARAVELREQRAQQALLRAQIESLQARVNPHFLFNALNTVASLVEDEPERAVEAIERLSTLLRYSLEGAREGTVPLRRELEAVRGYLALEGLRFDERLRSEVEVAAGLGGVLVPPFVLQPLVENAVKHGIGSRREGGRVRVTVEGDAEHLRMTVEDDGPGRSQVQGTRSGHETLRQRLQLLYGSAASFQAGAVDGGGYRVELQLPRSGAAEGTAAAEAGAEASGAEVAVS